MQHGAPTELIAGYQVVGPATQRGRGTVAIRRGEGPTQSAGFVVVKPLSASAVLEARHTATLRHPNLASVLDVVEHNGRFMLVREHVDGCDLRRVVENYRADVDDVMPVELAARIVLEVARGLAYAHAHAVAHREMSPTSVMLTFDGAVKLTDVGTSSSSPQARGPLAAAAAQRADVHAVAAMLYLLLTGRAWSAAAPTARDMAPEVPAALDDLCARALRSDVAAPAQDASGFADALQRFLATREPVDDDAIGTARIAQLMRFLFPEQAPSTPSAAARMPAAPAWPAEPRSEEHDRGVHVEVLIAFDGRHEGSQLARGHVVLLGSAVDASVRLDDPSVLPHHAALFGLDGQLAVVDVGQAGATHVNGLPLQGPRVLSPQDTVGVGRFTLKVRRPGADDLKTPPHSTVELRTRDGAEGTGPAAHPVCAPSGPADDEGPLGIGSWVAGRYWLEETLGTGAAATVFRAHDAVLQRRVALKLVEFDQDTLSDERRFDLEVETLSALPFHANVVRYSGHGRLPGGRGFLCMSFVDGRTLQSVLRSSGALPWRESVAVVRGIAAGLATVHDAGVIHRDLKPANVLVVEDGATRHPVLVDFGICQRFAVLNGPTRNGTVVGTLEYAAPERLLANAPVDARCDLYSLGCLWFELVTGERPFRGSGAAAAAAHLREPAPRARSRRPDAAIAPAVDDAIARLLCKDPTERFASARELLEALHQLDEGDTAAWSLVANTRADSPFSRANTRRHR